MAVQHKSPHLLAVRVAFLRATFCFGNCRHALRLAALRATAGDRAGPCPPDRDGDRHGLCSRRDDAGDIRLRAKSEAHADADPYGIADPDADAEPDCDPDAEPDRDELRPVGREQRAQSRLELPGTARQPGLQRRQPGVTHQSRRWRCVGERGGSALPHMVRRLRRFGPHRSAGRFRRRQAQDVRRRRRFRCAGRAGRQSRLFRRPEPYRHRRAARAAVGDARPDPDRLQRLRRQGSVDLGLCGGARFRQGPFQPGHRLWPRDGGLSCGRRRRADRDQLLLDQGPDAHRAKGRARICAGHGRGVPGGRRARSAQRRLEHDCARAS